MNFVQFPLVVPSSMSFSPPEFPIGEDVSIGGVYTRRKFGNLPAEGRLQAEFRNISNTLYAQILSVHFQSKGVAAIIFDSSFFNGAGNDLLPYLNASIYPGLNWFFVKGSPPKGDRVEGAGELVNVSLEVAARLTSG